MPTAVETYAALAFDTLYSKLTKSPPIPFSKLRQIVEHTDEIPSNERFPLFVTWNILRHGNKELRGCIGNFGNLKLPEGVKEYALIAALEDTRFDPIKAAELPKLSCSVTLLKNFERVDDIYDWKVGKHGIRILINGRSTATFLPDVAVEQGWSKEQTLQALVQKAGYYEDYKDMDIQLTRYQGIKDSLDYGEYLEIRERAS
ncbi:DEKNAAC101419 [Brettanomyces naardenensis]|uniref:DEKNAAC101419 n=1 Tax=Brettanomyces naardenensis TaxID=13370 RepID=A0A448YI21_BRENA|nr:DEKNAAC101419 [Brettanomyces naardenensis]